MACALELFTQHLSEQTSNMFQYQGSYGPATSSCCWVKLVRASSKASKAPLYCRHDSVLRDHLEGLHRSLCALVLIDDAGQALDYDGGDFAYYSLSVIVIGDFRQPPPVCRCKSSSATVMRQLLIAGAAQLLKQQHRYVVCVGAQAAKLVVGKMKFASTTQAGVKGISKRSPAFCVGHSIAYTMERYNKGWWMLWGNRLRNCVCSNCDFWAQGVVAHLKVRRTMCSLTCPFILRIACFTCSSTAKLTTST